jgi:hypothetical protein
MSIMKMPEMCAGANACPVFCSIGAFICYGLYKLICKIQ